MSSTKSGKSLSLGLRKVDSILPQHIRKVTVGSYLAQRLREIGLMHYFTVPGDFTLPLLDELLKEESLTMIGCCNELNAGYAADGYARAKGIGCVIVTYMVGGLSVINAIAGSYSDDLPVLCISGGPNINDSIERHLVHHTIGELDINQQAQCFAPIVERTYVIRHPTDCARMIDNAIHTLISSKKPVYLEIPVNLSTCLIDAPIPSNNLILSQNAELLNRESDPESLAACVADVVAGIEASVKPVLVAGSKLRRAGAQTEFRLFADALSCAVASLPDAKGLFPEQHPNFIGRYWGSVSSPHCAEVVESADLIIMAGAVLNDTMTVGWSAHLPNEKLLLFHCDYVQFGSIYYPNINMKELLLKLAERVTAKRSSLDAFRRYTGNLDNAQSQLPNPCSSPSGGTEIALSLRYLQQEIQALLTASSSLVVETGDSWFIGQNLSLPDGCKFYVQMQYASIGWSIGALLGVALAADSDERAIENSSSPSSVIALVGDGSFQMTAQEVSTILRQEINATIILINNGGYTIEAEIHDGPYNDIVNWDYVGVVAGFNNKSEDRSSGELMGRRVTTNKELTLALSQAREFDGLCFIECVLARDDCTQELLEWGARVARANGRR